MFKDYFRIAARHLRKQMNCYCFIDDKFSVCQGCINEPGEGVEDGVEPPLKDCEGLKGNMDQGRLLGLFVFNL